MEPEAQAEPETTEAPEASEPEAEPSAEPSMEPSVEPTVEPTEDPEVPEVEPTEESTVEPTEAPLTACPTCGVLASRDPLFETNHKACDACGLRNCDPAHARKAHTACSGCGLRKCAEDFVTEEHMKCAGCREMLCASEIEHISCPGCHRYSCKEADQYDTYNHTLNDYGRYPCLDYPEEPEVEEPEEEEQKPEPKPEEDPNLPKAIVKRLTNDSKKVAATILNSDLNKFPTEDDKLIFDCAVEFITEDTPEDLENNDYASWIVDFIITTSAEFPEGSSVILSGYYPAFCEDEGLMAIAGGKKGDWLGMQFNGPIPQDSYSVMSMLDPNLTYAEVVNNVGKFKCGIVVDTASQNSGLGITVTVQLVMTDPQSGTTKPIGDAVQYAY